VPSHPPFDGHRVEQVLENTGLPGFGASNQNRTEGSQDLSSVQDGLKNVEGLCEGLLCVLLASRVRARGAVAQASQNSTLSQLRNKPFA
jgi:hypothetical protein